MRCAISASHPSSPRFSTLSSPNPCCPSLPEDTSPGRVRLLVSHRDELLSNTYPFNPGLFSLYLCCTSFPVPLFFPLSLLTRLLSLSLQEMIIDKVNGQPVPRYLIYDIIKFSVSSPGVLRKCCLLFDLRLTRVCRIKKSDRINTRETLHFIASFSSLLFIYCPASNSREIIILRMLSFSIW